MTEIIVEDDAVSVAVQNVVVEVGNEVASVDVAGPTVTGLDEVVISAPLVFDSYADNLSITKADASHNGYLSSGDWSAFNAKQAAGNYITALTGDVTAAGPGSAAVSLANVNSNIGTYNNLTVNAKGLVTGASNASYQAAYSAFNNGQVLFGNVTSTPAQDSNLNWDNINKRLGIARSPGKALDVSGDVRASNSVLSGTAGFAQSGGSLATFGNSSNIYLQGDAGYSLNFGSNGATQWQTDLTGQLLPASDNSYDVGSSSNQVRNGYFRNKIGVNAYGTSAWTPSAGLHINAKADGSAGSAPIKLSGGTTLLSSAEDGTIEYNGTHLYFTSIISRYQLDRQTAKAKVTASDANTSISAVSTLTILPTPTANRTLAIPFPFLYTGEEIIIWNKSTSSSFVWTFVNYARDPTGATLTTLSNATIYRMVCDGTIWVKTN